MSGWRIIQDACAKYPDQFFTVIRPDSNVTVIPRKFIEEIHNRPETEVVATDGFVSDLLGKYTRIHILLNGHLGGKAVLKRLTPRLAPFARETADELELAAEMELPRPTEEWKEFCLNACVVKVVSRLTAKLFVGDTLCRNPEWVKLNLDLVEDIFRTTLVMRHFPTFMHPFLGAILPSRYGLERKFQGIHSYLVPLINERRRLAAANPEYVQATDVLAWMDELAEGYEKSPSWLATRYIWTLIGSLHSVSELVMNSIYDLCEHPEYFAPLRQEIEDVLQGGTRWGKTSAQSLLKMDSFIKEVQRHHPPSAFGFKRVTHSPIEFSDGTQIPVDTYMAVATTSPSLDGFDGCDKFDGLRYYADRVKTDGNVRCLYTATDKQHIHFGHGRHACPGRFAAAIEIKLILAKLLSQYDFKRAGTSRPREIRLLEFTFNDPTATIMMRRRKTDLAESKS
ncbi:MAG: hypothetical protein MMC33_001240 [Icmadophila ericetorum]|nr:hypothetical protein [Icmadophila ericetorum]